MMDDNLHIRYIYVYIYGKKAIPEATAHQKKKQKEGISLMVGV